MAAGEPSGLPRDSAYREWICAPCLTANLTSARHAADNGPVVWQTVGRLKLRSSVGIITAIGACFMDNVYYPCCVRGARSCLPARHYIPPGVSRRECKRCAAPQSLLPVLHIHDVTV